MAPPIKSRKISQFMPQTLAKLLAFMLRQGNEEVRYRGAQNMLKAIQENAGDQPVVITGDFNANMNETPGDGDRANQRMIMGG